MEDDVYNIKGARGILYMCGTGRMREREIYIYIYILPLGYISSNKLEYLSPASHIRDRLLLVCNLPGYKSTYSPY